METKRTNSWINGMSEKLIHFNETAEGKSFANVSVPYTESKNGYLTVGVSVGQVRDAKSAQFKNILLGAPDTKRQVSVCVKKATKTKPAVFETVELTNAEIQAAYDESRKAYKAEEAAKAAAAQAE